MSTSVLAEKDFVQMFHKEKEDCVYKKGLCPDVSQRERGLSTDASLTVRRLCPQMFRYE